MASYKEHCADCKRELGNDWGVVHIWLDEYFKTWGANHRSIRHHLTGVEECRKRWGEEAGKAAEIHIRKDFFGKVPKDAHEVELIMDGVISIPRSQLDSRVFKELPRNDIGDGGDGGDGEGV